MRFTCSLVLQLLLGLGLRMGLECSVKDAIRVRGDKIREQRGKHEPTKKKTYFVIIAIERVILSQGATERHFMSVRSLIEHNVI